MTEQPVQKSVWSKFLGRSLVKAIFGTDIDLSDRQTAATILATVIVGTLCWLAITVPETRGDIIKTLSGVIFVIIGFYFGKSHNENNEDDEK